MFTVDDRAGTQLCIVILLHLTRQGCIFFAINLSVPKIYFFIVLMSFIPQWHVKNSGIAFLFPWQPWMLILSGFFLLCIGAPPWRDVLPVTSLVFNRNESGSDPPQVKRKQPWPFTHTKQLVTVAGKQKCMELIG